MKATRPALSRAELLHALQVAGSDESAAERLASLLQFVRRLPAVPGVVGGAVRTVTVAPHSPEDPRNAPPEAWPPQSLGDAHALGCKLLAVVHRRDLPANSPASQPPINHGVAGAPDPAPRQPGHAPHFEPLVRPTQLWPWLRQSLAVSRASGIDWRVLQHQVARAQVPQRLPVAQRSLWGGLLWVVVDLGPAMQPHAEDMHQALRLIARLRGRAGLHLWGVAGRPDQLRAVPNALQPLHGVAGELPMPPPGTTVLLLGDAGATAPDERAELAWLGFAQRLHKAGSRLVCWAPVAPAQVSHRLAAAVPMHTFTPAGGLRRQRGRLGLPAQRTAEQRRLQALLQDLQVRVSACVWLEPALLRALRLGAANLRAEPALESLYWADDTHVSSSHASKPLRPAVAAQRRPALAALPLADRLAVLAAMRRHHAGRPRSTEAVEASIFAAHAAAADAAQGPWPPELAEHLRTSQQWLAALAGSTLQGAQHAERVAPFARDLLARQADDAVWQRAQAPQVAALWAAGGELAAPQGLGMDALLAAQQRLRGGAASDWLLLQHGQALVLHPAGAPLPARAASWVVGQRSSGPVIVRCAGQAPRPVQPGADGAVLLGLQDSNFPAELALGDQVITLDLLPRPPWARAWWRDAAGLWALAPSPWGQPLPLRARASQGALSFMQAEPQAASAAPTTAAQPGGAEHDLVLFTWSAQEDQAWREHFHQALAAKRPALPVTLYQPRTHPVEASGWREALRRTHAGPVVVVVLVSRQARRSTRVPLRQLAELPQHLRAHGGMAAVLVLSVDGSPPRDWPELADAAWWPAGNALQPAQWRETEAQAAAKAVGLWLQDRHLAAYPLAGNVARAPAGLPTTLTLAADAEFGLYAELWVAGEAQRLRWLPPGEFWMGSPDDEPQRYDDEGPRHLVRLTQGLWLADTACTQALWQAVMGSNPAHFKGDPQRPVEQVSFDDVQQFLARLQPLLPPGCQAALPTEAEWEYACRAGGDTAFHFGATISREQVNFDASNDTPLAPRGHESQSTVPVKSLPPNPWGLHEMHGNVWEWCDDHGRSYPKLAEGEVAEDPVGTQQQGPEAHRAVRGGSCLYPAHAARSAYRRASLRRAARHALGFRLALRSTSPEAPEGPSEPEAQDREAAPQARPGLGLPQAPRSPRPKAHAPRAPAPPPAQAGGGGALGWLRGKFTGANPGDKPPPPKPPPPPPPKSKGRK